MRGDTDRAGPADAYDAARPGYPPEVVAHIVDRADLGPGRRVLDLGAGTGKLGQLVASTGARVVAVEPIEAMRSTMARVAPDVVPVGGRAEAIGLASGWCDAVVVAQAFHWFALPGALREIRRVLVPGGHLVLVWNVRDTARPWVREFCEVLTDLGIEPAAHRFLHLDVPSTLRAAGGFTDASRWSHRWEARFDGARFDTWVHSLGLAGGLGDPQREQARHRIRRIVADDPELRSGAPFGFPFTTVVWSCRAGTSPAGRP